MPNSTITRLNNYAESALNATRHGILSRNMVLSWENEKDFVQLMDGLMADFAPKSAIELHLMEEIAGVIWRKGRLSRAESSKYVKDREQNSFVSSKPKDKLLPHYELDTLMRYEVHLDRKLERLLGLLFKMRELVQNDTPGITQTL